jgi:HEAT repeat protein
LAVARIADARGRSILAAARSDGDPDVVATVAFATGQLKDDESVGWLSTLMSSPSTPPEIAREAAQSLGKIRSATARAALAQYLAAAPLSKPATAMGRVVAGMDVVDRIELGDAITAARMKR